MLVSIQLLPLVIAGEIVLKLTTTLYMDTVFYESRMLYRALPISSIKQRTVSRQAEEVENFIYDCHELGEDGQALDCFADTRRF